MICKPCGSDTQSKFTAEVAIHFPGLKGLEIPFVWVFPPVLACLSCGDAKFDVPETALRALAQDGPCPTPEERVRTNDSGLLGFVILTDGKLPILRLGISLVVAKASSD